MWKSAQNIDEKQPENLNAKKKTEKQTIFAVQYTKRKSRTKRRKKERTTVIYRYKRAFTSMIQMFLGSRQFVCATKQSGKRCLKLVRNVTNHSIPCSSVFRTFYDVYICINTLSFYR